MLTFLSETRKVNSIDKNTYDELELLINKHYYLQNKIVSEYEGFKYYKKDIIKHLLKNKINSLREKIIPFGNVHLIDNYYEVICDYIVSNISKNEISDAKF